MGLRVTAMHQGSQMLIQLYRAKAGSVSSAQSSGEMETEEEDKTADRLWKMVGRRAAERD